MRFPSNMMKRLGMLCSNGLAGAGPELYAQPKRSVSDRNPVARTIPYFPFVPANMLGGAGTITGQYQRSAPFVYNAQPVVVTNNFGGAGMVASGSRLGSLARSTQVASANS